MVSVRRRSRRNRRPAHSIYDDAKDAVEASAAAAASSTSPSARSSSTRGSSSSTASSSKKKQKTRRKKSPAPSSSSRNRRKKGKKDDDDEEELPPPPVPASPEEESDDDDNDERMEEEEEAEKDEEEDDDDVEMKDAEPDASSEEEEEEEESDDDDDDADDEHYKGKKSGGAAAAKKKKKSPRRSSASAGSGGGKKKPAAAAARRGSSGSRKKPATVAAATAARNLRGVAKAVLDEAETPENSIFAALVHLLQGGSGNNNKSKKRTRGGGAKNNDDGDDEADHAELDEICRRVLSDHDKDPNRAQVSLFNLLFRSVGTTHKALLDADEIDLEVASDDDWEEIVSRITDGMEDVAPEKVMLSSNPDGAVAEIAAAMAAKAGGGGGNKRKKKKAAGALGAAPSEYRKLYKDFWYRLGAVAMAAGGAAGRSRSRGGGEDNDGGGAANGSSRFQVETAREILSRMIEVSGSGQPDIRAAAAISIYQFTQALLDHSADLWGKVQVATRQLNANKSKSGRKAEMLQNQIDSYSRTLDELQEIVITTVMSSVFTKRYRDSNKHVRAESIRAVSRFTLSRPDMLLKNTYLKYFGWMLSDQEAVVRLSAVEGFLAPFREAEAQEKSKRRGPRINTSNMNAAIQSFLPRIADCVLDVDYTVQERAMELVLILLKKEFFESVEDDRIWDQINLRALERDTTPTVRRDALAFVLDQIESFDSGPCTMESRAVERIDALAKWLTSTLKDGDIPVEEVKYDRVDYVVHSLRSMEDHKDLFTHWSALLRALESDDAASQARDDETFRFASVRQRIILRMFVCAAELEVSASTDGSPFLEDTMDEDFLAARAMKHQALDPGTGKPTRGGKKKAANKESPHEKLTQALLDKLPDLLETHKVDTSILRELTTLPLYFHPSILSLPNRKRDFVRILSKISSVFQQSTDDIVLKNCALVLTAMAQRDHARTPEALLQLKNTVGELRDRLLKLIDGKMNLPSSSDPGSDNDDDSSEAEADSARDLENSISLSLGRLVQLARRWDIADLLGDEASEESDDEEMDALSVALVGHIARELVARQIPSDENAEELEVPEIWSKGDQRIHAHVAETVKKGLDFLLSVAAWRLNKEVDRIEDEEENDEDVESEDLANHIVLKLRNCVVKVLHACFAQHIDYTQEGAEDVYSKEHLAFVKEVEEHACKVAGDLRVLFPKLWIDAASPLLRALALHGDSENMLLGGLACVLTANQAKLRENEEEEKDPSLARRVILPVSRAMTAIWSIGHRREAGNVLSHIIGSGPEAQNLVSSTTRVLKKIEPIRVLESHMACLQQDFFFWMDAEPQELGDRPSEDDLEEYEANERLHQQKFQALEDLAGRLSASLGVGRLSADLASALMGFVQEGIRFSFTAERFGDEEEIAGARLPFLRIMGKYLSWIKRNKNHVELLRQQFNEKEAELRNQPEYEDLVDWDLETLAQFRKDGGFGRFVDESSVAATATLADDVSHEGTPEGAAETRKQNPRMSVSSNISLRSKQTPLSPLPEEGSYGETGDHDGDSDDQQESPSSKSRKSGSVGARSMMSHSTAGKSQTQPTIAEGDEEIEESSDGDSDNQQESPSSKSPKSGSVGVRSARSTMSQSTAGKSQTQATVADGDEEIEESSNDESSSE